MLIKDLQTGKTRAYGSDHHDSLVIDRDGRTLSYYNLQNGDGSRYGDYRFVTEVGEGPEEEMMEAYFNIGGFGSYEQGMKDMVDLIMENYDNFLNGLYRSEFKQFIERITRKAAGYGKESDGISNENG